MVQFTRISASTQRQKLHHVVEQVRDLQRRRGGDLESALRLINESTVESVPGALCAGITVIDGGGGVTTVSATHEFAVILDDVQRERGEGPCLSAAWDHHTTRVDDLTAELRWPRYTSVALTRTPVRSIVSFRLFEESDSMGALNLYGIAPHAFDDEAVDLGVVFASHTALVWNMFRRDEQFRSALASRDTIAQAKGMLMERFSIDAVAAFELLKQLSQESNTKLVDIADRLVREHHKEINAKGR